MQKARGPHLPRTAQLRRFGAIGPDTMLAGAKMRICPKPADSQNSSSSISPTNDRPSKCQQKTPNWKRVRRDNVDMAVVIEMVAIIIN